MADSSGFFTTATTLISIATGAVVQLFNSVWQWRKSREDHAAANRRADSDEVRAEAADHRATVEGLRALIGEVRNDLVRLRRDLWDERRMREQAEASVRTLQDEVGRLRAALAKHGITADGDAPDVL